MRAVTAVAQRFPSARALHDTRHIDLKYPFADGQRLDGTALMRIGVQNATGVGRDLIPLQPLDSLDPADNRKPDLSVFGD